MSTIGFESLQQLFPADADIPQDARLRSADSSTRIARRRRAVPWDGACKTVLSPVCVRQASMAKPEQVEIGSYPVMGEAQSDAALDAAVRAYDSRPRRMADDDRRRSASRACRTSSGAWWRERQPDREPDHVGDRQEPRRIRRRNSTAPSAYMHATIEALKELDNSNSRFMIAEGTIGQIRRTPLGVVLCMGPYNYPLNETFATLIPALLMGNTVVFKPPQYGTLLFYPLLAAFRDAFPKGVINTIYAPGAVVVPHMLASGKVRRAGADRIEQGGGPSEEAAPQVAPAARGARPRREERRHRPARRGPRPRREGMPARRAVVQRPALHGAQDADRAPLDRRYVPERFTRATRQAEGRHALGEGRVDHAAARAASNRLHDRSHRRREGERRARGQRGRRRVLPDAVLPGCGLSRCRKA